MMRALLSSLTPPLMWVLCSSQPGQPPRAVASPSPQGEMNSSVSPVAANGSGNASLVVDFDNDSDPECTVITIEGQDQSDLLMSLTGAFVSCDVLVNSASISSDDGVVRDVFRVTTMDGRKVPGSEWATLREQILGLTSSSSRSGKPAIYGMVAAAGALRV